MDPQINTTIVCFFNISQSSMVPIEGIAKIACSPIAGDMPFQNVCLVAD